jgi:hypothetical protein
MTKQFDNDLRTGYDFAHTLKGGVRYYAQAQL